MTAFDFDLENDCKHLPAGNSWWYLQFIGVRNAGRGNGGGRAMIAAGLDCARAANCPVSVDVMNPDNLPFYRGAGFSHVREYDIPAGGPRVRAMVAN